MIVRTRRLFHFKERIRYHGQCSIMDLPAIKVMAVRRMVHRRVMAIVSRACLLMRMRKIRLQFFLVGKVMTMFRSTAFQ